jgi:hypothetical protein
VDQKDSRMSATLNLQGLNHLVAELISLKTLDATPLMRTWQSIIAEDNRKGILAGTDKDGVPMTPVTYRPKEPPGFRVTKPPSGKKAASIRAELNRHRLGQRAGLKKGGFSGISGFGPNVNLPNNNLSTAQYQLLAGPPLAPRDQFSRVITNLKTTFTSPGHGSPYWAAIGAWDQVVNTKGLPFLFYHFNGIGQKRRDLRGVRPGGIVKAIEALRNWARLAIREHFAGH